MLPVDSTQSVLWASNHLAEALLLVLKGSGRKEEIAYLLKLARDHIDATLEAIEGREAIAA